MEAKNINCPGCPHPLKCIEAGICYLSGVTNHTKVDILNLPPETAEWLIEQMVRANFIIKFHLFSRPTFTYSKHSELLSFILRRVRIPYITWQRIYLLERIKTLFVAHYLYICNSK